MSKQDIFTRKELTLICKLAQDGIIRNRERGMSDHSDSSQEMFTLKWKTSKLEGSDE